MAGDAVCAFNPVYGQGMTAAALGAITLGRCLREQRRRRPDGDLAGLARRFQKKLAASNTTPWLMATGEDFRYPSTEGGRPGLTTRLMHRYMDQVMLAGFTDPHAHRVFIEVAHLLKPPAALFQPRIAIPALRRAWQSRRPRLAQAKPQPS